MTAQKRNFAQAVPLALAAVCTLFLVVPLAAVFIHMDVDSFCTVFAGNAFWQVVGNSCLAALLTTVISMTLAYILAWCVRRTAMPCKGLVRMLVVIPMLIPSVSIGMGVVILGGNNGILSWLPGLEIEAIYGLRGIVWGSVLYALPVAFLMMDNVLKYEDSSAYEAAEVLGIGKCCQFFSITLPYLRKPMIVSAFSVFTLSFTDYGVPLMVGGKFKTLPLLMYQEVIGQLNFAKGCVYAGILLIPAVVAFLVDLLNKNDTNATFVTRPFAPRRKLSRDIPAGICAALVSAFSLMPIAAFVVRAFVTKYPMNLTLTLDHISKALRMGAGKYLVNSIIISALTALIGVALAVLTAYYTARSRGGLSRYLHLLCMSVAAVPGIVLGLSYVLTFKGSFLYGTIAILVIVNVVHFFASPYLMMYTALNKVNKNLETVAATLGISNFRLLWDVLLPKCRWTVQQMLAYFFVNSMMTISAVSFLTNSVNKPVALMINQFEAQAQTECAAVVSLAILLTNLGMKLILEWLPQRLEKRCVDLQN